MPDWESICNGCVGCAMRCTDGIKLSEFEYTRIVELLRALDPSHVRRVLDQPKEHPWFEGVTYVACRFLDIDSRLCLVYPARPFICRLFGRVPHLPCPEEKIPADLDARRVMEAYVRQPLHTFAEWMMAHGLFNFDDLLGVRRNPARYEL